MSNRELSLLLEIGIDIGLVVFFLALGFSIGSFVEKRHYRSIRRREEELSDILVIPVRTPLPSMMDCESAFICGSVVIGMDYFKKALAYLRNVVGGQMGSYETLVERARREAILRMKQEARRRGAKYVLNVKFSTANIMGGGGGKGNNKGSGCVEVIAYGTALIPRR